MSVAGSLMHPAPGAELLDADIGGEHVFALRRGGREYLRFGEREFPTPVPIEYPVVRSVRRGLALLIDPRTEEGRRNAWMITSRGEVVREFFVGDGVEDVMVCGSSFVITYADEGVFGDTSISHEGVAVFDQRGTLLWGYNSRPGRATRVDDCYCAVTDGENRVWFSPYMQFPLVELRLDTRAERVMALPPAVHWSFGVTTDGTDFWFHTPFDDGPIRRWTPRSGALADAGSHPGRLRGLFGRRFVRVEPEGYELRRV